MPDTPFAIELPGTGTSDWRFSCKEMFDIPGFPATCGHPGFASSRQHTDTSLVIRKLQEAGAVLRGKTKQSELAISALGENRHQAPPLNARNPKLVPGGSSSGCGVAVARGLVHFSVATDTAGSARIPAACNGVIGLSLANSGHLLTDAVQLAPTLDQLGLLARDAQMLQRVLGALDLPSQVHTPEELLIPADLLRKYCSTETISRFYNTVASLRAAGWRITEASSQPFTAFDELQSAHGSLALAEISHSLQGFIGQEREQIDPGLLERLHPYLLWSADELAGLRSRVSALAASLRDSVWLLPTLPCAVPLASAAATSPPLSVLTKYANLMAMNSISIPAHQADSIMLQSASLPALLGFAFEAGSDRKP